jgi:hypothetical protein
MLALSKRSCIPRTSYVSSSVACKRIPRPKANLFDRYRRLPSFLFVKDGKTDSAGGVHVGMEERRIEFACNLLISFTQSL